MLGHRGSVMTLESGIPGYAAEVLGVLRDSRDIRETEVTWKKTCIVCNISGGLS